MSTKATEKLFEALKSNNATEGVEVGAQLFDELRSCKHINQQTKNIAGLPGKECQLDFLGNNIAVILDGNLDAEDFRLHP